MRASTLLVLSSLTSMAACNGARPSSTAPTSSTSVSSTSASSVSVGSGGGGAQGSSTSGAGGSSSLPGWKLVWSDEFNGPDGSAVDPTKWVYGGEQDGMYNKELEYYAPSTDNVFVAGGYLHIVAKALPSGGGGLNCWYGPCQYTSGKIQSKAPGSTALFEKQFGRISARMKLPAGQGMWPAFWMLGSSGGWPACGEIDIMENIGNQAPTTDYGTVHGPDASGQDASLGGNIMNPSGALADGFHEYTVEWKAGEIRFLLDDTLYFTATPASYQAKGGNWVFDSGPFYLILNLAIGGNWPGNPDASTPFPAEVLVDWVRVYDPSP